MGWSDRGAFCVCILLLLLLCAVVGIRRRPAVSHPHSAAAQLLSHYIFSDMEHLNNRKSVYAGLDHLHSHRWRVHLCVYVWKDNISCSAKLYPPHPPHHHQALGWLLILERASVHQRPWTRRGEDCYTQCCLFPDRYTCQILLGKIQLCGVALFEWLFVLLAKHRRQSAALWKYGGLVYEKVI